VYVWVHKMCVVYVCVYNMYVYVYYVYGYTRVCMRVCTCIYVVCACVRVYVRVSSWVGLRVVASRTHLVRSGPVIGDLD